MNISVYHHRHYDIQSDCNVVVRRFATLEYIERNKGGALIETKRDVHERLVDADGRAIVDLDGGQIELLRELATRPGRRATISGNADRRPLRPLADAGLIHTRALNLSDTEHELTELGALALEQLA